MAQETENVMRMINLEKVVLNMGVGKSCLLYTSDAADE